MAFASLSGASGAAYDVVSGVLTVPRSGVWHADLVVDTDDAASLSGALTLTLGEGASAWQGTFFRGGDVFGRIELRMVGGAGGLAKQLPGQSYRAATLGTLLEDILAGAGESLDVTVDADLKAQLLPAWTRIAGPASTQLLALLAPLPAVTWRVLQGGTIWVGEESWPDAPALDDVQILDKDARVGRWPLGVTTGYQLLPGQVFQGLQLQVVEHTITTDAIRTTIWFGS